MKHAPLSLLEARTIRSAGRYSWSSTRMTSPTYRSFHSTSVSHSLLWCRKRLVFFELVVKSLRYRFRSSKPSLMMDREITNTNGAMAERGFRGEMAGMDCMMAVMRK